MHLATVLRAFLSNDASETGADVIAWKSSKEKGELLFCLGSTPAGSAEKSGHVFCLAEYLLDCSANIETLSSHSMQENNNSKTIMCVTFNGDGAKPLKYLCH